MKSCRSIRILQQAVDDIPEGPILSTASRSTRCVFLLVKPMAVSKVRKVSWVSMSSRTENPIPGATMSASTSFINLTSLGPMCIGNKIADVVVILGSIDIVLGEVDR